MSNPLLTKNTLGTGPKISDEISLNVYTAKEVEGQPQRYYVRGKIGPLFVNNITVTETTYQDKQTNEEREGLDVNVPTTVQKGSHNPHTGKPYRNIFYRPTEKARNDFNRIVREAVLKHKGKNVAKPLTKWPHSLSRFDVLSINIHEQANTEKIDEAPYIAVATVEFAGFEINGVWLKLKPSKDKDGNDITYEKTDEDGEFNQFYIQFPSYPEAGYQAKKDAGQKVQYYDYVSPSSKDVRVIMRDEYVRQLQTRLQQG